jgi:hypothetical protein
MAEMLPIPPAQATERQLKRLKKLNVAVDSPALTEEGAEQLIRDATSTLDPTPKQLARAAELKVSVPEGATRGVVGELIDRAERREAIRAVRRRKVSVADDASWEEIEAAETSADDRAEARKLASALRRRGVAVDEDMSVDELTELDYARRDLEEAMREVRGIGFAFAPPESMTGEDMLALSSALGEMEQAYRMMETSLDHFVDEKWISRRPRKAAIKAALPFLFERIRAGTWRGDTDDDLAYYRHALTLEQEDRDRGSDPRPPKESQRLARPAQHSIRTRLMQFWQRLAGR